MFEENNQRYDECDFNTWIPVLSRSPPSQRIQLDCHGFNQTKPSDAVVTVTHVPHVLNHTVQVILQQNLWPEQEREKLTRVLL